MREAISKRGALGVKDTIKVTATGNDKTDRERLIDDLAFLALCQFRHRQHIAAQLKLSEDRFKSVPD